MKDKHAEAELVEINWQASKIVAELVERAVRPYIVAIYAPRIGHPNDISQVGTGFLVQNYGEVVLVSARHVYYGQTGGDLAGEKLFFVNGVLSSVGNLSCNHIYEVKGFDLACVRMPELAIEKGMPEKWLETSGKPKHICVLGYLARDFKRSRKSRTLRPAPRLYSNRCRTMTATSIVMEYPKSRNAMTETRKRGMAPVPRGISGGPMVSADQILLGSVNLLGVFTEYVDGTGTGVPIAVLQAVLQHIRNDLMLVASADS